MTAARSRAGLLSCSCDFDVPEEGEGLGAPASLGLIAAGFGFSVLAQALAFAALPIAGAVLAPSPGRATLPVVVMLAGAASATFPASILTGLFGRRSAFALGASLGVAGAALGAWGILAGQFAGLCLGAFWLGAAQGFSLFYRHSVGAGARGAAIVLGAGSFAALAAPAVAMLARDVAGPWAPAAALAGAGAAQLCVLALAAPLPSYVETSEARRAPAGAFDIWGYAVVTFAAALAWFGMMALMAGAPLAMVGCGLGLGAVSGAIAWHLLAMYAPAAVLGAVGWRPPPAPATCLGLAVLALACLAARTASHAAGFDLVLIVGGFGWSIATLGATQWLHARGRDEGAPPRGLLALHDLALFAGAVCGALAAAAMA